MKTILKGIALALSLATGTIAQPLPDDLTAVPTNMVTAIGDCYFSIKNWGVWAPLPFLPPWSGDLYYSPSMISTGNVTFFIDDLTSESRGMMSSSDLLPPGFDGGGSTNEWSYGPSNYTTNFTDLWISIDACTNTADGQTGFFTIHNTTPGKAYEIISSTNVTAHVDTNHWISEGIWLAESTNLPASIPVGSRTNQNFFMAHLWTGFNYGVPTNGQLYLLLPNTNSIQGIVNGITNTISPVYSNWAVLKAPVYDANFGYDGSDSGPTFISGFTQQNVRAVLGFSKTISNLCLAYNPLTNIDTHGWPNLQYLEMWHATNLISANVTNCPKLYRVCFESIEYVDTTTTNGIKDVIDFTGCTNLADLRAANNNITNIIFGPNGGSNIWHFCTRDARNRSTSPIIQGVPFASLPSLRQLWVWRDFSYADNIFLTVSNSPKLESVQAFGNYWQSAHFHGQTNLTDLQVSQNRLTNLVVSGCTALTNVIVQDNYLPNAVIDSVLTNLDALGQSNGRVFLNGASNGVPSATGLQAITNLASKGWSILYNPPSNIPQITGVSVVPGSNSATITWTTANVASDSTVYWGTTTSYGSATNNASLVTSHSMTILGLTTNTLYHFAVTSMSAAGYTGTSGDNQFTTLGRGVNTNVIWFVSTSAGVAMQAAVDSGATVTWYWSDGSTNTGTSVSHSFGSSGSRSNAVVVDPADALKKFGVACQSSADTTLSAIGGLTNYPQLQGIYAYVTGLSTLSLAGCTNLNYAALVGTSPSTATANAWFNDLATAQAGISAISGGGEMCGDPQKSFFCQSGVVDSGSSSARTTLTGKGWSIYFYP